MRVTRRALTRRAVSSSRRPVCGRLGLTSDFDEGPRARSPSGGSCVCPAAAISPNFRPTPRGTSARLSSRLMPSTVGGRCGNALPNNRQSSADTVTASWNICSCRIGFARQHEYRLDVEWRGGGCRRWSVRRCVSHELVVRRAASQIASVMFRLVGFDDRDSADERPAGAIAGLQRLLDDRPDALEEILAKATAPCRFVRSPCDTIDRAGRPSPAGRHTRSCSTVTGTPGSQARDRCDRGIGRCPRIGRCARSSMTLAPGAQTETDRQAPTFALQFREPATLLAVSATAPIRTPLPPRTTCARGAKSLCA